MSITSTCIAARFGFSSRSGSAYCTAHRYICFRKSGLRGRARARTRTAVSHTTHRLAAASTAQLCAPGQVDRDLRLGKHVVLLGWCRGGAHDRGTGVAGWQGAGTSTQASRRRDAASNHRVGCHQRLRQHRLYEARLLKSPRPPRWLIIACVPPLTQDGALLRGSSR
jgi:hypothetical protein